MSMPTLKQLDAIFLRQKCWCEIFPPECASVGRAAQPITGCRVSQREALPKCDDRVDELSVKDLSAETIPMHNGQSASPSERPESLP